MRKILAVVLFACFLAPIAPGQERVDLDMIGRIRQEGFRHSRVMESASHLMDAIGPRLTGSPNMKKANEWTRKQLEDWGLSNAHLESWGPFGRGWSYEECEARMTAPDTAELLALPLAWTPSTEGTLHGTPVKVKLETKEDLEKEKGKLTGKIVLLGEMREVKPDEKALSQRYDEKSLSEIAEYAIPGATPYARPGAPPFNRDEYLKRRQFDREVARFMADEKVAAVIEPGPLDGGTFRVQGAGNGWKTDAPPTVPTVVMAIEHYGRLARLLDHKEDVQIDLTVRAKFYDQDPMAYNTVAEIPGTDKKGEVVMLGGHMDSWHGGTGATDNGAGVVVAMEAVRILKALDVHPKRTIRIALWSGEEEGLFGSKAYVAQHFGSRPEPKAGDNDLPSFMRPPTGPLTVKPEHARLSAYFNLDNGTGKVRGIYTQENVAAAPIFEAWIAPLKDLGVTTVTNRNTFGTDHVSFDSVGLPGFQFIQDEVEYDTRTHHTNMDVYERLQREDLMQASVVMAWFVYDAAVRDAMMPRKALPREQTAGSEAAAAQKGPRAKPDVPAPTFPEAPAKPEAHPR